MTKAIIDRNPQSLHKGRLRPKAIQQIIHKFNLIEAWKSLDPVFNLPFNEQAYMDPLAFAYLFALLKNPHISQTSSMAQTAKKCYFMFVDREEEERKKKRRKFDEEDELFMDEDEEDEIWADDEDDGEDNYSVQVDTNGRIKVHDNTTEDDNYFGNVDVGDDFTQKTKRKPQREKPNPYLNWR